MDTIVGKTFQRVTTDEIANEILLSATDTIRERGLSYGHPADNMQHTAMLLSAYLQTPIHDYQVAAIMVLR
jgi:hypothetical protein